ncbi:hypothetical protein QBC40DRAFT_323630 [Triangularia verruculosa]|uniref:Uncharacterized protein n=1 Tax=Triangularia verruculosa TaxID=2587418 RepID=A0AAN6XJE1_9PEZI|nr:hypothetical protein QBC40DRAFT_323630 [Triangularia verruculosa]
MAEATSKTSHRYEQSTTADLDGTQQNLHAPSADTLLNPEAHFDFDEVSLETYESDAIAARSISTSHEEVRHFQPVDICLEATEIESSPRQIPERTLHLNLIGSGNHRSGEGIESCSPVQVSPDDIELQHFAEPCTGTRSTDRLAAPPDLPAPRISVSDAQQQSSSALRPHGKSCPERSLSNYKPIALRWPFQVFLLAIVIAMFAFLEYQIHDLPPLRYKALQMGQQEDTGFRQALLTTSTSVFSTLNTPVIEARPLPKSLLVAPTPAARVGKATILARDSPEPTARLRIMAPRPDETLYPSPQPPVTAFCGWGRPYWNISEYQHYNLWDALPSYHWHVALEELIPVFTTTDPSWCPCTMGAGFQGNWPWGWPDLPMWDTHDEGCKSVMNVICSFNYYKVHTWSPKPPSAYQFRTDLKLVSSRKERGMYGVSIEHRALDPMTTPPSSIHAFWGYPRTDSNNDVMFPLEVRTARLEQQDVFGNRVERDEIASFPVNYRWMADSLRTEYANGALDITPCSTDMLEVWWYQDTLGTCTETPSSYTTVWWTLPFGKPATSNMLETQSNSAVPGYASLGTDTSHDIKTHTSESNPPSTLANQEERPTTTFDDITAIETAKTSERLTSLRRFMTKQISATKEGEHTSLQSAPSKTETQGPAAISSPKPEATSTVVSGTIAETKVPFTRGYSPSVTRISFVTSNQQKEQEQSSELGLPPIVLANKVVSPDTSLPNLPTSIRTRAGDIFSHDVVISRIAQASGDDVTIKSALKTKATVFVDTVISQILEQESRPVVNLYISSVSKPIPAKDLTTLSLDQFLLIQGEDTTKKEINGSSESTTRMATSQEASTPTFEVSSSSTDTAQPHPMPPNPIGPIPPEVRGSFFNLRSEADYLMASLIPVLLATLLGIPVQIAVSSLNAILPFRALAQESGALADDSLHLSSNSWLAPLIACKFLHRFKDPLPLLNVLLGLLSTILIPLSAETIRLEFTSINCKAFNRVCAFGLRKAGVPMRVAEGVLVAIAMLVIAIGVLLSRWKSRVATEPWSIAAMAGLLSNAEVRELLRSLPGREDGGYLRDSQIAGVLAGRRYRLGFSTSRMGDDEHSAYGIEVCPVVDDTTPIKPTIKDPPTRVADSSTPKKKFWHMKPATKELLVATITLFFIAGLLILILYYENTILDTPFERFMDSQSFGVRILFTSFGTIVSGCWDYFFSQISRSQIYHRLSTSPQPARTSILISPPSSIFTGLWQFARSRDILPFNIAFAALLAKFTPILFSNIPYMVVVLVVMVYVGWKKPRCLPVGTDTIVGCMYYLVESEMLSDFEGMGVMGRKERDRLVRDMERLYYLGRGRRVGELGGGDDGMGRVAVDYLVADPGVERKGGVEIAD